MEPDYSRLYHRSSQSHAKGHPAYSNDPKEWPEEWLTTYYKTYPRFERIPLDVMRPEAADFFTLVSERKSRRDFTKEAISLRDLSILLKFACGTTTPLGDGTFRRAHPSAGGRFPLEVYPIALRDEGDMRAGLYHYNVQEHSLETLWARAFYDGEVDQLFSYDWVKKASVVFIMTSVFARTQNKYGERGYRYILLEAGHIAQNVYLIAEALGIKCTALVGTRDEKLEKLLDIDGVGESVVYAVALGR